MDLTEVALIGSFRVLELRRLGGLGGVWVMAFDTPGVEVHR